MSRIDATAEEIAVVKAAVKALRDAQVEYAAAYKEYLRWCREHRPGQRVLSRETLRMWIKGDTTPRYPGTFYDYAKERLARPESGDTVGQLSWSVRQLFPSGEKDPNPKLKRLEGTFEIIRRLWFPSAQASYLRCVVTFRNDNGVCRYNEVERFKSPHAINEFYTGYVFLYGTSFWIIAHERQQSSVKFLAIHECNPPLTTNVQKIDSAKGTLIAVAGRGPNHSHPFILQRIKNGDENCFYLNDEQLIEKLNLDKASLEYLQHPNGE